MLASFCRSVVSNAHHHHHQPPQPQRSAARVILRTLCFSHSKRHLEHLGGGSSWKEKSMPRFFHHVASLQSSTSSSTTTTIETATTTASPSAFTTSTLTTVDAESIYQSALLKLQLAHSLEMEFKETQNRQQYEAFQKQQQEAKNNRRGAAVAVIKTIAKQSRATTNALELQQESLRKEAQTLMEEAALSHGHAKALVQLGTWAWLEQENIDQAKEYYHQAGEQGSSDGWYNLGNLLWQQQDDYQNEDHPRTNAEAMQAFLKAVELGDADAMYFVGNQYLMDEETDEQMLRTGLNLIERAADQGHCSALFYLAMFYLHGDTRLGIEPCTWMDYSTKLNEACDAGSPEALFVRGHDYYEGKEQGVTRDYQLALRDFLAAADLGHADAAVSAGAILHRGVPDKIPRDQHRAFQLYQHAGELGSIEGWRNVAACYALGEGVKQSDETAKYIAKTMLKDDI